MVFQFKNNEVLTGTVLVRTKLFCLVKTTDGGFVLINKKQLKNNNDADNNSKQSQLDFDTEQD